MNVTHILTKFVAFVSFNIHKARLETLFFCIKRLPDGDSATVTSIGRGIPGKAYEKHRIKRADRFLSSPALRHKIPGMYSVICRLFCSPKHPVIAVDWSDMDKHKTHFLIRASIYSKDLPSRFIRRCMEFVRKKTPKLMKHSC